MLEQYPTGLVACVSDSYDIVRACRDYWGTELRDQIMSRDGTLVVRPDSGDPVEITEKVIEVLGEKFGYERNAKGYKVLDPHVRIIQGDGIDAEMVDNILDNYVRKDWSADNIAFGSGGGLLQKFDRDTCKFAFKCSAINRAGQWYDVFKDPVTDTGKRSKKGKLKLVKKAGNLETIREGKSLLADELRVVFEDGKLVKRSDIDAIRER